MKAYLVSLGCPKNWVDSELIAGQLCAQGCEMVEDPEEAELIVVNSCAFLESAVEESVETVLELAELKSNGRCRSLVLTGCLVQRYGEDLVESLPEVDHFLGTKEFPRIAGLIESGLEERAYLSSGSHLYSSQEPRRIASRKGSAYIKIAEGCDRRCSFCMVPSIRGRQCSRQPEDIEREAIQLVRADVKELVLVAQDLTAYGTDLSARPSLESLLERLEILPGVEWIRLMYCYPQRITEELLRCVERSSRVLPYLDVPLQHLSDRILKSMRRGITGQRQRELVERLRRIEGLVLRTTMIVGYPGESESEFEELCAWVRQVEFERMGVFTFSKETGTEAAKLPGQLPEEVKQLRRARLLEIQQEISLAQNRKLIGRELDVLVEGYGDEHEWVLQGRYYGQAPEVDGVVFLSLDDEAEEDYVPEPGTFVRVEIEDAAPYDLVGRILGGNGKST